MQPEIGRPAPDRPQVDQRAAQHRPRRNLRVLPDVLLRELAEMPVESDLSDLHVRAHPVVGRTHVAVGRAGPRRGAAVRGEGHRRVQHERIADRPGRPQQQGRHRVGEGPPPELEQQPDPERQGQPEADGPAQDRHHGRGGRAQAPGELPPADALQHQPGREDAQELVQHLAQQQPGMKPRRGPGQADREGNPRGPRPPAELPCDVAEERRRQAVERPLDGDDRADPAEREPQCEK